MNIQQKNVSALVDRIDEVNRATNVPHPREVVAPAEQELTPPVYGEEYRKAIDSLVEGVVSDLCRQMAELHDTLKTIEQEVLKSAERARGSLRDHAGVCVRVRDEIKAMKVVIGDLARETHEPR